MEITQEVAKNILSKKKIVHVPGVYECKHRVGTEIRAWEETGEAYRIVNTDLMSAYSAQEAKALFNQGEYQTSTNKGMSFRANLELAEKLEGSILSQVLVEEVELKSGDKALMIRKITPKEAQKATTFSFEDEKVEVKAPVIDSVLQTVK